MDQIDQGLMHSGLENSWKHEYKAKCTKSAVRRKQTLLGCIRPFPKLEAHSGTEGCAERSHQSRKFPSCTLVERRSSDDQMRTYLAWTTQAFREPPASRACGWGHSPNSFVSESTF